MPWARDKERINKNKQTYIEFKQTLKCTHCSLNDYRLIEFHHLGNKDKNISRMINNGYSWRRIQKEISKCIPLCCNCHRLEHWINNQALGSTSQEVF